jgi:hypothetical protein
MNSARADFGPRPCNGGVAHGLNDPWPRGAMHGRAHARAVIVLRTLTMARSVCACWRLPGGEADRESIARGVLATRHGGGPSGSSRRTGIDEAAAAVAAAVFCHR